MSGPEKPRSKPPKTKQGGATGHGFIPDDDPRYESGWNFLGGKNLNPHRQEKSADEAPDKQEPEPPTEKPSGRAYPEMTWSELKRKYDLPDDGDGGYLIISPTPRGKF